ncbi:hypothetical protein PYCC9005_003823 [Savitreella phatthalungensis]
MSFFENVKDRASLARQQSKRFSISSMGSLRWSYKSDQSEGTASTASSISSSETSSIASGTPSARYPPGHGPVVPIIPPSHSSSSTSSLSARAMHSSHGGKGNRSRPLRTQMANPSGFEPLYMRKLRQDNERRARIEAQRDDALRAQQTIHE